MSPRTIITLALLVALMAAIFTHDTEAIKYLVPLASMALGYWFERESTRELIEKLATRLRRE